MHSLFFFSICRVVCSHPTRRSDKITDYISTSVRSLHPTSSHARLQSHHTQSPVGVYRQLVDPISRAEWNFQCHSISC